MIHKRYMTFFYSVKHMLLLCQSRLCRSFGPASSSNRSSSSSSNSGGICVRPNGSFNAHRPSERDGRLHLSSDAILTEECATAEDDEVVRPEVGEVACRCGGEKRRSGLMRGKSARQLQRWLSNKASFRSQRDSRANSGE